MILKIGYDPSNVKATKEILKKKNANIASLRKQLKIPSHRRLHRQNKWP
jgi:hypothetical protein